MKITKRGVNVKRHTTHYLCGGKWRTRSEAVKLAKAGKVDGVVTCSGSSGNYIKSSYDSDMRLYDLPESVIS